MKIKYLIILIINLIFLNSIVNSQTTQLTVSSSSGIDNYQCGGYQPCKTIDGALNSYKYSYGTFFPLVLNFFVGTYSTLTSQNLTSLNVTFNAMPQNSYDIISFASNLTTPMFSIYQTSPSVNTYIYFNGIEIVNPTYTGIRTNSFIHIDPSDYEANLVNIEFNQVSIPYGLVAELIYVDGQYVDMDNAQYGWSDSMAINSASSVPSISISFFDSQFGNDFFTSSFSKSLVYSPKYPISLTVDSCNFTKVVASETLFPIGGSQISFSNIQMSDVLVSFKPFFIFENSQITIRDSSFAATLESAQFLISFGSFLDFRNNEAAFNYQIGFWNQDYPVLDIEKSFATISNSTISLDGQQQQQTDQGVIYAVNSDISLRLNLISSNISFIINSDGSNFYGYLLTFQQTYTSQYNYLVCSKNHKSTFRGDETFGYMPTYSKNCNYYDQYINTVSALNFVFVGVAFVLLCSAIVCCFRICFEKRKLKKKVDTHIYTPVSNGEITPINPSVVPIDSSS
ncbi:hypothetical protein ACTFIY_012077 [Dictyostelium cf. discoideum]